MQNQPEGGFTNMAYAPQPNWGQQQQQYHYPPQAAYHEPDGPVTAGQQYQTRPKMFCNKTLLLVMAVAILFFGTVMLLLGYIAMEVDSKRKVYETYDKVYEPTMKKLGRRYIRERFSWAYLGFGIWLGGVLALCGILGIGDYIVKGAARVIYVVVCGFSLLCCIACIVFSSWSIVREDNLCKTLLFGTSTWRACQGPYSTFTMKSLYGLLITVALFSCLAILFTFCLSHYNPPDRKKRSKKYIFSAQDQPGIDPDAVGED